MKGSRVQAVVQELRGEKIDIVPFDRDPARFVMPPSSRPRCTRSSSTRPTARMELVVPDEKLSLAIGRKGQNVRLASQLTGWKLDIISESKFKQMEEEAITALASIESVDRNLAQSMYRLASAAWRGRRGDGAGARRRSRPGRSRATPRAAQARSRGDGSRCASQAHGRRGQRQRAADRS